jgi:hypothetical protein
MKFFLNKSEREDLLSEAITGTIKKIKQPIDSGIYVDPKFELSDDAKFGLELAKDKNKWNEYFGI